MAGVKTIVQGLVSRLLPQGFTDDRDDMKPIRLWRYGEQCVQPMIRKTHALVDEGGYFIANNAQTGIASPVGTSFAATAAMMIITNTDTERNSGKRIYLDYLALVTTAAGSFASAGVNLQAVVTIDTGTRYSSGGTNLTANIINPNMDAPARTSVANVYFGALTATAATSSARTVCGLRILRPVVSATVADVVGELKLLNFGGVEAAMNGSITVAVANQIPHPMPAIVIGPQQTALVHFIMNGTTPAAASYAPEIGWFER